MVLYRLAGLNYWASSSPRISRTIHLYANRTPVVQPHYQQKPLWYSKQTLFSLLCCQRRDNEATGTYPTKPLLQLLPQNVFNYSLIWMQSPGKMSLSTNHHWIYSIGSVITLIWDQLEPFVYLLIQYTAARVCLKVFLFSLYETGHSSLI